MEKIKWNQYKHLMRLGIGILCMITCFVVEWGVIDRLTYQAYEVRYQADLEAFRQNSVEYVLYHKKNEVYDIWLEDRFQAIYKEIQYFPVEKSYIQSIDYVDSWYGERSYGGERRHEGTDLMSDSNVRGEIPIVSMTDGLVKNMGWLQLGGWRIGIESESGVYYYYAHLDSYAENLQIGSRVYAGQLLGFMGDSGYGEEGTTGMFDVHLHLGIYIYDDDGKEISVNPFPFLEIMQGNYQSWLKQDDFE